MSSFWLGTWSLSGEGFGKVDLRESHSLLELAHENGITAFDTAGIYSHGAAERLLAKVFKKQRTTVVYASKGGLNWKDNTVVHDASPDSLKRSCYESLDRLETDYLDLFSLHWPDPKTPISESLSALSELKSEGVIKNWGVCNLYESEILENLSANTSVPHQIHFNPIHNTHSLLKTHKSHCKGPIQVYSPLEQGLLGDSISNKGVTKLGNKDVRRRNDYFKSTALIEQIDALRETCAPHPLSLYVYAWILNHVEVDTIVLGAKTPSQLRSFLSLKDRLLDEDVIAHSKRLFDNTLVSC